MTVGEQPSFYIYPKHFSAVWRKLKRLCDVAGPGQIYSVSARFNPHWLKVAPIWAYAGSGELDAKTWKNELWRNVLMLTADADAKCR